MAVTSVEFLARILNDAPQPLWVIDEDGRYLFVNPAAVATLGYDDAAELHGRRSHDTVHYKWPDGSPCPREDCPLSAPIRQGRTAHGRDEWFVRRDGSMFPIDWWTAPIAMPRGNGAVLMFTDISQQLAAERALRERDAAEIRTAESRAAQRRIVESAAAVRREVARDLHGGAQQRLVGVLAGLRTVREALDADPARAHRLLGDVVGQAQGAIDELRELATGVHPPLLAHRGLVAAVEELAYRGAVPVTVAGSLPWRLPEVVETSAYFFVTDALADTVRAGRATRAAVTVGLDDATLWLEVSHDGDGGAAAGAGSGLADRVGSLGGRTVLLSPPGGGATLRAEIPVGPADGPTAGRGAGPMGASPPGA